MQSINHHSACSLTKANAAVLAREFSFKKIFTMNLLKEVLKRPRKSKSEVNLRIFIWPTWTNIFSRTNLLTKDPFDAKTDQGPQVDGEQMNKILDLINSGKTQGAKLMTGGKRHGDQGFFVQPTVFADVKDDMRICKEGVF